MVTYFVGQEEVTAYLRDFLNRLSRVNPFPTVWCPITPSGDVLARQFQSLIQKYHPDWINRISVVPIRVQKDEPKIRLVTETPDQDFKDRSVLLFDGATHTGGTMSRSVAEVVKFGASDVCTYSLMLKCDSTFIPTMWGFMIDRSDRAHFLLPEIPNLRLCAKKSAPPPAVHLERISEDYCKRQPINCGVASLDRVTWGDRWFGMVAGGHRASTYAMVRRNEILGYLSIHHESHRRLLIDEVAVDTKYQGKGLSGILMRFADTLARQSDCKYIRLQAIADKVPFYQKFGYKQVSEIPIRLDNEEYFLMERALLHGLPQVPDVDPLDI